MNFSRQLPDKDVSAAGGAVVIFIVPSASGDSSAGPKAANGPAIQVKASGASQTYQEVVEARKKLIYSLPGTYPLVSSDQYMQEKYMDAAIEDR